MLESFICCTCFCKIRTDMASGRATLKSLQYTQIRSSPPTFTGSNFFIAYLCPTTRSEIFLYCALLISCTAFCKSTSEVIIFIKENCHEFAEERIVYMYCFEQ